jgi:hypothetical protein
MNARRLERLETEAAKHARPESSGPSAAELRAMSDAELLAHYRAYYRKWMAARTPEERAAQAAFDARLKGMSQDELLREYREGLRG